MMRHWADLHQEGEFWCGEFSTDEVDIKLAELIVNMQFTCQRHFFGSLADKYFDDKLRDVCANRRHNKKTVEGYNRLSEKFTVDDAMKAFNQGLYAAKSKIKRLMQDGAIEKVGEFVENGTTKAIYEKKCVLVV